MAESTTPNPVEQVKALVKQLEDQKAELLKQVADIEQKQQEIADAARGSISKPKPKRGRPAGRPGRKPGRKPGVKGTRGRKATPVADEDKAKLLAAMKEIGKDKMRSGDAFKKAGIKKPLGKKVMKALANDGKVKIGGPWVSLK
jgi:hypothetical protein